MICICNIYCSLPYFSVTEKPIFKFEAISKDLVVRLSPVFIRASVLNDSECAERAHHSCFFPKI